MISENYASSVLPFALADHAPNSFLSQICVYVALYSGHHRLEQLQTTEKVITSVIEWNETLTFGIDIADLPRSVYKTNLYMNSNFDVTRLLISQKQIVKFLIFS